MYEELILGLLTFFTSTVAGIVGIGGGMILVAILPSFLPLNALIPVHGLTQMSSNLSRAVFGYKDIRTEKKLISVIENNTKALTLFNASKPINSKKLY